MPIYKGNTEIQNLTDGGTQIREVYKGDTLVWSQSRVYVAANNSQMEAFDGTGASLWHKNYSDGDTLRISTKPDGEVVAGYQDNLIRKLDSSGNELWTDSTDNNVRGIAFGPDGYIYYGTDDGEIARLTSAGNQDWSNTSWGGYGEEQVYGIDVDTNGYVHVVTGGGDFSYHGMFNTSDGSEVASVGAFGTNWRSVAVNSVDNRVYATNAYDNSLNAFSYDSGGWTYEYDFTDFGETPTQVAIDDQNLIYVACWDDTLYIAQDSLGSGLSNAGSVSCTDGRAAGVATSYRYYGGDGWNNKLRKYDTDETEIWNKTLTDFSTPRQMAVAPGTYGTFPGEW